MKKYKVAITTGDPNGIGFEITSKALFKIGPHKNTHFFIFRDQNQHILQEKYFKLIEKKFIRLTFSSFGDALKYYDYLFKTKKLDKKIIFDISHNKSAAHWVYEVINLCDKKIIDSMVTAPLSKTLIKSSGFNVIGHTGFFREYYPHKNFYMAFIGRFFNVVLANDHIPLNQVESNLFKKENLKNLIKTVFQFKGLLESSKKIGVLGLNPHSGEEGLIAQTEIKLHPYFKKITNDVDYFLVPDAAFLKQNWNKYCFYLCLYHDQGLIPFKMIHGQDSGVHLTLGLPFIRTSVDHGTAFDIFNKNSANPNSMVEAIKVNLNLIKNK